MKELGENSKATCNFLIKNIYYCPKFIPVTIVMVNKEELRRGRNGEWLLNRMRFLGTDDENVLELGNGDDCKAMWRYWNPLNCTLYNDELLQYVTFITQSYRKGLKKAKGKGEGVKDREHTKEKKHSVYSCLWKTMCISAFNKRKHLRYWGTKHKLV